MKIVHVIFSLTPGGAEMLVKDIVTNSVSDHCIEVWAVGTSGDPDFEDKYKTDLISRGITVLTFNKVPHKNRIKAITSLRKAIKRRNPDIIHTHSEIITIYTIIASLGLNKIIFETIHNTVISYPKVHRILIKNYIRKYVAISESTYKLLRDVIKVPPERIETIFNGIDIRRFQTKRRTIDKVRTLIAVGRLDEQKDHLTLIKSYSILKHKLEKNNVPVPVLMIVGMGRLQSKLENYIEENNLGKNIILTGARSDIPELLESSDMWIMSSKWEGLSIALLEALAAGMPVVATNVGSNHEVITHGYNGSLVPRQDEKALADEIFNLILDKNIRLKYSVNALKAVEEFSISKCAAKYNALYNTYYKAAKPVSIQQF